MSKFITNKKENEDGSPEKTVLSEGKTEEKKEWKPNYYKNRKNNNYKNRNNSGNNNFKKNIENKSNYHNYSKNRTNEKDVVKKSEKGFVNYYNTDTVNFKTKKTNNEENISNKPSSKPKQSKNPRIKKVQNIDIESRASDSAYLSEVFHSDKIIRAEKSDIQENSISIPIQTDTQEKTDAINDAKEAEKVEIIGVRLKPAGKIYFFSPNGVSFSNSDSAIVETIRGVELGSVVIANRLEPISNVPQPLNSILKKAENDDLERARQNKTLAKEAIVIANEKIKVHNLKMKLLDAEYTFDNAKLIYYFAADGRVDFRELAKDLASIFKVRIELRQIGVRDQAKLLGGISVCGRPFCCNSFLPEFNQVAVKMAKDQNIALNSVKISGACGRLMCCLKYEHDTYEKEYATFPRINTIVETPEGNGIVVESNILSGVIKVSIAAGKGENKMIKVFGKKDVKIIGFLKTDDDDLNDEIIDEH